MSEIAKIFKSLPKRFNKAGVKTARSYYFSLGDDEKWTVHVGKDECTVEKGRKEDADCFFKAAPELFLDVWNGTHKLGPTDFLTGRVKSNNKALVAWACGLPVATGDNYELLRSLVESAALRQSEAMQGRENVKQHWQVKRSAEEWLALLSRYENELAKVETEYA